MSEFNFKNQRGISIYLVILFSTFILAISLGISSLLVTRMKIAREIGYSVIAFYAADTGIEEVLDNPDNFETTTVCYRYLDLTGDNMPANPSLPCTSTNPGTACTTTLLSYPDDACYAVKKFTGAACPVNATYCIESVGYYKKTRRAIQVIR